MTSRTSKLLSVMVLAACLSGCVMFDMEEKPEPDKEIKTTTMAVDEVRSFPFRPMANGMFPTSRLAITTFC